MASGIRRTGLMQAKTQDPFMQLINQNNRAMARQDADADRALKESMFGEEMGLKREKFASDKAYQDARLGLARAASARAAAAAAGKPSWYERERQKHLWGLEDIAAQQKGKIKPSDKSAIPSQLTQSGALDEDSLLTLQNTDATLKAAGVPFSERERQITGMVEGTSAFNPINWRDYSLKENLFY